MSCYGHGCSHGHWSVMGGYGHGCSHGYWSVMGCYRVANGFYSHTKVRARISFTSLQRTNAKKTSVVSVARRIFPINN